jgi:7-dehydrocholesterol reductase
MAKTKETKTSWGSGGLLMGGELGRLVGSILLLTVCPAFVILVWHVTYSREYMWDGTVADMSVQLGKFLGQVADKGLYGFFSEIWPTPFHPLSMKMIGAYMAFELVLQRWMPGKTFVATETKSGWKPVYVANGVQSYLASIAALFAVHKYYPEYTLSVYDNMGYLLSSMNLFALIFVFIIMLKGLYAPSTPDCGTNNSWVIDYFWGTELYPNIFGWDVKQFTNCRFGMMYWQLGIICYALKQMDNDGYLSSSMFVSVVVQSVYIFKFFWWETGYFCSMDIQHDRAGYYICWGCLVWVPSVYTIHTYAMVQDHIELSLPVTLLYLVGGIVSIWINYDSDRQRQEFRATGGRLKIWGQDPEYIVAKYKTDSGERESLLLCSGWWGLSRHFHYVPEIAAATFWCTTTQFTALVPWFYPIYLTILLFDRAWRDDARCSAKYGKYWDEYCERVPYKVIPGII